jgi:cell division inhibitor SulA/protein ImuA
MQHAHGTHADALAMVLANPAIWRGAECAPEPAALPSGFSALDAALPGRGWPGAALTEITLEREGIGELRLVLPALVALQRDAATAARDIVWIAPPYRPYAPALAAAGLDLARLYVVHCATPQEALWAYEQALRAPECGAAFAWLATADQRLLRRLAVAAREGRTFGVLWRRPGEHAQALSAALRLQLAPRHHQLAVRVLKRRGGELTQPVLLDIERTQPALLDSERTQAGARAEVIPLPLPALLPPAAELQVPATAPAHAA